MTTLSTLIERLCAATGPDREIDRDIWWMTDHARASKCYWNAATGLPQPLGDKIPGGLGRWAVETSAPNYTASIDAALTLVPDGISWEMYSWPTGSMKFHASCGGGALNSMSNVNPAIAICIAALKAREATQ